MLQISLIRIQSLQIILVDCVILEMNVYQPLHYFTLKHNRIVHVTGYAFWEIEKFGKGS